LGELSVDELKDLVGHRASDKFGTN